MTGLEQGLLISCFSVSLAGLLAYVVRLNTRMGEQDKEIEILKTKISPLWMQVQARISSDLHHPSPRYLEMDALLEKLEALTITDEERTRLKVLLEERSTDMHAEINDEQRAKAKLMIGVMDLVLDEARETKP
ncbi:MAG: hypothetical protein WBA09_22410 [Candidatus Acidiferrum sp.]